MASPVGVNSLGNLSNPSNHSDIHSNVVISNRQNSSHQPANQIKEDTSQTEIDITAPFRRDIFSLVRELRSHAASNLIYYGGASDVIGLRFYSVFTTLHEHVDQGIEPGIEYLLSIAPAYDFDSSVPGNGYRSFITVMYRCCTRLGTLVRHISSNRESLLFRSDHYSKELEAYVTSLGQLRACMYYLLKYVVYCQEGCLLLDEDSMDPEDHEMAQQLLVEIETLCQESFYGRCLGFQFCESMSGPLSVINLVLASFGDSYHRSSMVAKIASTVYGGTKYFMDPELKAKKIIDVTRNGDIDFCKAFWSLNENPVMHMMPKFVCPHVSVSRVMQIPPESFFLPLRNGSGDVSIPVPTAYSGPAPVNVRLISHEYRWGQATDGNVAPSKVLPKSEGLAIHTHGGGFVAQSSASHQIYLRHWARDTAIPILCVDYSLAPEHPYPRQLEEVFFAYCWAIKNADLLGWTGQKVCLVGDSAGGTLAVSTALKAISFGVRVPDGVLSIYGCLLVEYAPSPSRILSVMDPLLPLGVLPKCLGAYAGPAADTAKNTDVFVDTTAKDNSEHMVKKDVSDVVAKDLSINLSGSSLTANNASYSSPPVMSASSPANFTAQDITVQLSQTSNARISVLEKATRKISTTLSLNGIYTHGRRYGSNIDKSISSESFSTPPQSPSSLSQLAPSDLRRTNSSRDRFNERFCKPVYAKTYDSTTGVFGKFHNVPMDRTPFKSPLLASDELLAQMCPVYLLTTHLDPMLDDSVEFAKRLRAVGQFVHLDVLPGLPHGFLNFVLVSGEAKAGSVLCTSRILDILSTVENNSSGDSVLISGLLN